MLTHSIEYYITVNSEQLLTEFSSQNSFLTLQLTSVFCRPDNRNESHMFPSVHPDSRRMGRTAPVLSVCPSRPRSCAAASLPPYVITYPHALRSMVAAQHCCAGDKRDSHNSQVRITLQI